MRERKIMFDLLNSKYQNFSFEKPSYNMSEGYIIASSTTSPAQSIQDYFNFNGYPSIEDIYKKEMYFMFCISEGEIKKIVSVFLSASDFDDLKMQG